MPRCPVSGREKGGSEKVAARPAAYIDRLTIWSRLTNEPLESPVDAFTSQLTHESVNEGQLPTIDDDGDVGAQ